MREVNSFSLSVQSQGSTPVSGPRSFLSIWSHVLSADYLSLWSHVPSQPLVPCPFLGVPQSCDRATPGQGYPPAGIGVPLPGLDWSTSTPAETEIIPPPSPPNQLGMITHRVVYPLRFPAGGLSSWFIFWGKKGKVMDSIWIVVNKIQLW